MNLLCRRRPPGRLLVIVMKVYFTDLTKYVKSSNRQDGSHGAPTRLENGVRTATQTHRKLIGIVKRATRRVGCTG